MPRVNKIKKSLDQLNDKLKKEVKHSNIKFEDYLRKVSDNPEKALRNIFQRFHDMIRYYIPRGVNEYPNDPESINYIRYDTEKLFVENTDTPFFADRLLANRLINVADSLKEGVVKNKMLLFVGPPGSGKSTFLNNILNKFEKYTGLEEGAVYETIWQIDSEMFGHPHILSASAGFDLSTFTKDKNADDKNGNGNFSDKYLFIPCPSHDHPIAQVPREYRKELLESIIEDGEFKHKLFNHKEYEWIFKVTPCPVCSSVYRALKEKLPPEEILNMLYVRRYEFSRKLGEGLSVYNPGDKLEKAPLVNSELQKWINAILKSSDAVLYTYSRLAKTNNGIFAVMDVKVNNVERIQNLHGIISDGIHKVGTFEESINSLFLTLINPEDAAIIDEEKSFRDRVIRIPIPYIRDYKTEAEIYRNIFGKNIEKYFLPEILSAFARIIVSSRLNRDSKALKEWIPEPAKYSRFSDKNLLLLKMEIFTGFLPEWLEEEDVKIFDRARRRAIIINEGDTEGIRGFSGRDSLEIFNNFYNRYKNRDELIDMGNLLEFFNEDRYNEKVPEDFLGALERNYDYNLLQQIEESMFFYNKEQIAKDILDYLFAVNLDTGSTVECPYTGRKLNITERYYLNIERKLIKGKPDEKQCRKFRDGILKLYVSRTLQEINSGKDFEQTEQFRDLLKRYYQNLKENVLKPFVSNENFRRAIKDFGGKGFKNYDNKIREEVKFLIKNLTSGFGYTEKGAKQICMYVIDRKIVEKFAE